MIQFCGKMSNACQQYMFRRMGKIGFIAGLFTTTIFMIPLIFLSIYWDAIVLLFLPVLLVLPWLGFVPPSRKDRGLIIPTKITINQEENTISCESDKLHLIRYIDDVRDIIDMKEWYVINFCYAARDMHFVCEKQLLSQGTLKEFEQIFEGKIVKAKRI